MTIPYRFHLSADNSCHIILDAPSIRRPKILRTRWTPPAQVQRILTADGLARRLDGREAFPDRNYRGPKARWMVVQDPALPYDRPLAIDTPPEGLHIWREAIKPPTTRTPGVWFAWETGEWRKHGDGACALYDRIRSEHWHTPPWRAGQDMTPLPPTDHARHMASLEL